MRSARPKMLLLLAALSLLALSACTSGGQQSQQGANKVTICHATSSASNPYNKQTVAKDGTVSGHDGHANDIIPPFDYLDNKGVNQHYPGKNWDADGQGIYNNGCNPKQAETTPAPSSTLGPEGSSAVTTGPTESTSAPNTTGANESTVSPSGSESENTTVAGSSTTAGSGSGSTTVAGSSTTSGSGSGGTTVPPPTSSGGSRPSEPTSSADSSEFLAGSTSTPATSTAPTTSVAGATTSAAGSTTPPSDVEAATSSAATTSSGGVAGETTMPNTGSNAPPFVLLAAVLVGLGVGAVALSRKSAVRR